jgi:P4 family phage/plasmid primase-like protien
MSEQKEAPRRDGTDDGAKHNRSSEEDMQGRGLQAEISVFSDVWAKTPDGAMSVREFIMENIAASLEEPHAQAVNRIREALENLATPDQVGALKKELPAASISGMVTQGLRANAMAQGRFVHSGFLQIDLDAKDMHPRDPEAVRDQLRDDPHVQAAWLSPTGGGVKGLLYVGACRTPKDHENAFFAAEAYFRETYALTLDKSCKDPVRLCFVSYDPGGWTREDLADPLPVPRAAAPHRELKPTAPTIKARSKEFPPPPVQGIHAWLMEAAWHCRFTGMTEADTVAKLQAFDGTLRRRLQPTEAADAARKVFSTEPPGLRTYAAATIEPRGGLLAFQDSDAGNAERFHLRHGEDVRYVRASGQWLLWNGYRWEPDTTGGMTCLFVNVMRELAAEAVRTEDPKAAQAKAAFALRSTNLEKVNSGLAMLKALPGITVAVDELDGDPWLVGAPSGVVDLRSGEPIRPERSQLITKTIGTRHDAAADCPRWREFIRTVTAGDDELAAYLQAAVGYTMTGLCREQCLFFLHGNGCNGKGVFSETIKTLIGDYGQTAPESLFTRDRNSSATNDVARLAGCRLAIAAELDEGAAFAESRIKSLTGADTITARFLHKEFFDFQPTHKFWVSGNHKPTVRGTDVGIWRRLRLVPFTVRITDEQKDPALADKLLGELPGILNWALEGCLRWQREGLKVPACVRKATEDYRREEDVIGQFLGDCTHPSPGERTPTTAVYQRYALWCEIEGIQPKFRLSARRLIRRIEEHHYARRKSNGAHFWEGLEITDPGSDRRD